MSAIVLDRYVGIFPWRNVRENMRNIRALARCMSYVASPVPVRGRSNSSATFHEVTRRPVWYWAVDNVSSSRNSRLEPLAVRPNSNCDVAYCSLARDWSGVSDLRRAPAVICAPCVPPVHPVLSTWLLNNFPLQAVPRQMLRAQREQLSAFLRQRPTVVGSSRSIAARRNLREVARCATFAYMHTRHV